MRGPGDGSPLDAHLTPAELDGPRLRVLNLGGSGNADVLLLERSGGRRVVVKDFGRRSALVRHLLAPLLVRHELAMLQCLEGLPGIPSPLGRVGRTALAMEYVDGVPLRRRWWLDGLPPSFFDALEGVLEGLAQRRVAYLDLRSPTNVLCTPSFAPALVDLGSAYRLPLPGSLRRWLERRALAKLRRRFEAERGPDVLRFPRLEESYPKVGGARFRLLERGVVSDPVPALLLHDVGLGAASFAPLLARAEAHRRRALAPDLPGFGLSSWPRAGLGPAGCAARLERLLHALRLPRVDLVGHGWGGLVARELATRAPARVRALLTFQVAGEVEGAVRRAAAARDVAELRRLIAAGIPAELDAGIRAELGRLLAVLPSRSLLGALRGRPSRPLPAPVQPWLRVGWGEEAEGVHWERPLADPDRFWLALAGLAGAPAQRVGAATPAG